MSDETNEIETVRHHLRLSVRVTDQLAADLVRAARAENNSPSSVVRRLLTTGLARERQREGGDDRLESSKASR